MRQIPLTLALVVVSLVFLTSCSETKALRDHAQAQQIERVARDAVGDAVASQTAIQEALAQLLALKDQLSEAVFSAAKSEAEMALAEVTSDVADAKAELETRKAETAEKFSAIDDARERDKNLLEGGDATVGIAGVFGLGWVATLWAAFKRTRRAGMRGELRGATAMRDHVNDLRANDPDLDSAFERLPKKVVKTADKVLEAIPALLKILKK